jgi:hypothetical protein
MAAKAQFSPTLGRGIVHSEDGVFIIHTLDMYNPLRPSSTNLHMWLQGPIYDIIKMDAGPHPYRAVYDRMEEMYEAIKAEALKEARSQR